MLIQPLDILKYVYDVFSLFFTKINYLKHSRPRTASKKPQIHYLNFDWAETVSTPFWIDNPRGHTGQGNLFCFLGLTINIF